MGIYQTITYLHDATLANLTYVGESYSHPLGSGSAPSGDDKTLLRWIGDIFEDAEVPAPMLIVADDSIRILAGEGDDRPEHLTTM